MELVFSFFLTLEVCSWTSYPLHQMLSQDDFTEAGYLSPLQIQTAHIAIVSLAFGL